MESSVFDSSTEPSFLQLAKANCLIDFTEFGSFSVVIAVLLKACKPIVVTELGISTEVKLSQPLNVLSSIAVTEFGITIDSIPL